ncbi:MAG TPA: NADH-quinone oxidoreductase subunit J [Mycobacteriales bacterium]|nr:NADH-quinone oxidoreductase subunit J [Mycobacteriales bacterium]
MTGADVVFGLLALLCLAAALLVVTVRNVIHAALWLVVCFGALAGCYLVLTAEFVAWVQVLIYIGAIVVLMLFGAMLTRAPIGAQQQLDSANRPVAALAGLAATGLLGTLVVLAFRGAYVDLHGTSVGDGHVIGRSVFRFFVLPFELASVLLLAALVGAIVLTRSRRDEAAAEPG